MSILCVYISSCDVLSLAAYLLSGLIVDKQREKNGIYMFDFGNLALFPSSCLVHMIL